MKTLKERIAIEQAFLDGEKVIISTTGKVSRLLDVRGYNYVFLWNHHDYDIKPEPMEFWVNIYNYMDDLPCGTHRTKEAAEANATHKIIRTIKAREVTDE